MKWAVCVQLCGLYIDCSGTVQCLITKFLCVFSEMSFVAFKSFIL